MAATTYSTLPSNTHGSFQTKNDPFRTGSHETYGSNIESLTSHPYPAGYGQPDHQHHHSLANAVHHTQTFQPMPMNPQTNYHDRSLTTTINPRDPTFMTTNPPMNRIKENPHPAPSKPTEASLVRSERQISNPPKGPITTIRNNPKINDNGHRLSSPSMGARQRSPSNPNNRHGSEPPGKTKPTTTTTTTTTATAAAGGDTKPNKSSVMRAAAIKKQEVKREQKRQDAFFPASEAKGRTKPVESTPETDIDHHIQPRKRPQAYVQPITDGEESDNEKTPPKPKSIAKPKKAPQPIDHNDKTKTKTTMATTKKPAPPPAHHHETHRQTDGEQSEVERSMPKKKGGKPHKNPPARVDSDRSEDEKPKSNKKNASKGKAARQSRRSNHQTDHSQSSDDDKHRSKSRKRTQLPAIHRTPGPPPLGHPMRYGYYDDYPYYPPYPMRYDYRHRHLYEDAVDVPPYLAPYHDPYDPFFDYEKRKSQAKTRKTKNVSRTDHEDNGAMTGYETEREEGSKSKQSRKSRNKNHQSGRKSRPDNEDPRRPAYHPKELIEEPDVLDLWRQERNDYLKAKFKPTVHDVLYSQQWAKADSYVENQRRRNLRDAQGFYFPYKRYTLKDYKDLQKNNVQNLYGDTNDPVIDRKDKAKKRQEYGALIERQIADNPGARYIPPREMDDRQPWHLSGGEPNDPDRVSKRERAMEYAKVQVKYRPLNGSKHSPDDQEDSPPHSNRYHHRDMNDDSPNERHSKINQSYDDYYD